MKNNNPLAPKGYFKHKYSNLKIQTKINERAFKSGFACSHDCALKNIYIWISDFFKSYCSQITFYWINCYLFRGMKVEQI